MEQPRPKSKEELVEEFRVESIQEAAMRVIARHGVGGASMQAIADEAGISKGTLYLYFENQRDLLERTVDYAFARLAARLEEAIGSEGAFLARLERVLRTQMEFLEENVTLLQLCGETRPSAHGSCDRAERPHYQRYAARFEQFIAEAVEAGEIRPIPAGRLALFIQEGFMAVLIARMRESERPSIDEEIAWLIGFLVDGVAPNSTKRRSPA